ncbi:MAG: response regulator [Oscillospiraceae bacterium]|nr:response regulator [Oscillospiraceae bacterium]
MFKLVIVEDEDHIRHSLECFIPWEDIGFQVVNTFSDGSDALAYLRDNPCDAVLTDILMSRMSGLDMIAELHQLQPQIKVVILSGHSDFAYARQAIEYQVTHYLVKPVDEDELMDVFKSIKEQLDSEHAAGDASQEQELKQMLQKSFFRDLLSGYVTSEKEFGVYAKLLNLEQMNIDAQLHAYEIKAGDCARDDAACNSISAEDICKKHLSDSMLNAGWFFTEEKTDLWRVVFFSTQSESLRKNCNSCMQALIGELNKAMACEYTFRLTHSVARIGDLLGATPQNTATAAEQQADENLCQSVVSDYKLLIMELDLGSKETLLHIINQMLYDLRDYAIEDVRFVLKNLYSVIELNYKKRKINVWDVTNGKFNFNHLYEADDLKSISACLREDFSYLCDGLKSRTYKSEHNVVERIVQYLNEHLNEDIGHDALAAKYRMHPGYLSRLFKQEMGETISEYLLRIRIERAAQLMKEGHYKIGEISTMVGYSASSYFSIMFKKYTGYSPREYCQKVSL